MKKAISTLALGLLSVSFVLAGNPVLVFNSKDVVKTDNTKKMSFTLNNAEDEKSVIDMKAKSANFAEVKNFTVSPADASGSRKCEITVPVSADEAFFQKFISEIGISEMVFNGKAIKTVNLMETIRASKERKPTNK